MNLHSFSTEQPWFFPVFAFKKKDIEWNKEQNIKTQAYVLVCLNYDPGFRVELPNLLVCFCLILLKEVNNPFLHQDAEDCFFKLSWSVQVVWG